MAVLPDLDNSQIGFIEPTLQCRVDRQGRPLVVKCASKQVVVRMFAVEPPVGDGFCPQQVEKERFALLSVGFQPFKFLLYTLQQDPNAWTEKGLQFPFRVEVGVNTCHPSARIDKHVLHRIPLRRWCRIQ